MTYAELYNEEIKDLLANTMASSSSSSASSSGSQSSDLPQERILKIVDDPHLGPLIQARPFFFINRIVSCVGKGFCILFPFGFADIILLL